VGIDDAVLELMRRLDAGALPEDGDEADVAREFSAQGFLVEDRAVDDRGLREHLEKGSPAFKMTTNGVLLDGPFVEAMRRFGEGIIKVKNVVEAAALIRLDRLVRRKRRDAARSEWFEASFEEAAPRRYLEELGAAPWDGEGTAAEAPPR
jgi:hypothetical protein